jgi:hypothetical protein
MQSAAQTEFWTLQSQPNENFFLFYDRVLEKVKHCRSVGVKIDDSALIALLIKSATQSIDLREQAKLLDTQLRGQNPPNLINVVEALETTQKVEDVNREIAKKNTLTQRDASAFKVRHREHARLTQWDSPKEQVPLGYCRRHILTKDCKFGDKCRYKHTYPPKELNTHRHDKVRDSNDRRSNSENKHSAPPKNKPNNLKQNFNRQNLNTQNDRNNEKPAKRTGNCNYCGIKGHWKGECRKFVRDSGKSNASVAETIESKYDSNTLALDVVTIDACPAVVDDPGLEPITMDECMYECDSDDSFLPSGNDTLDDDIDMDSDFEMTSGGLSDAESTIIPMRLNRKAYPTKRRRAKRYGGTFKLSNMWFTVVTLMAFFSVSEGYQYENDTSVNSHVTENKIAMFCALSDNKTRPTISHRENPVRYGGSVPLYESTTLKTDIFEKVLWGKLYRRCFPLGSIVYALMLIHGDHDEHESTEMRRR